MIKCKANRKKSYLKLKAGGTLREITTESLAIIQSIHEEIAAKNPEAAKDYKNTLLGVLLDPDSPIFKEGADLYE